MRRHLGRLASRVWSVGSTVGVALLLCLPPAVARSPIRSRVRLSLDDAIQRAAGASKDVALARHGVDAAHGAQLQARSGFFPQVSVSAAYDRTLASEFDDVFSAPVSAEAPGVDLENLPFGRENVYRAGATVSQNVFAGGGTLAATRQAGSLRRQSELGLASARAGAVLAAVEAYYDALLADRFARIAGETLEQAETTLQRVQLSRGEGQQAEFELLRARVAVENERPNVAARGMERALAHLRLRQQLGYPAGTELELSSGLDDRDDAAPAVARPRDTPPERLAVQQAGEAALASEAGLQAARADYYPRLDLSMSYGRVSYPGQILPDGDWRTNWTATALVSWPIFQGLFTRGQELAAQAGLDQARVRLARARDQAAYEAEEVELQLQAARAVLEAAAATTEQARRAYGIAELRFQEGISTQLELSDSRLALAQAESNHARAARDLRVARVRQVLLPELPLGSAGSLATSAAAPGMGSAQVLGNASNMANPAAGAARQPAASAINPAAGAGAAPAAGRGF